MAIDTQVPESDGWWLARLYAQLQDQRKVCEARHKRFSGKPDMPARTKNEEDAVALFENLSRRNYERVIVNAVLSRLDIVGVRTAADDDEGGDAEAFRIWRQHRGSIWSADAIRMALSMGLAYVIVGRPDGPGGEVVITAEDPRQVTAITDPANPYKVLAALKVFHDDVEDTDVAYLYLPGRVMVATKPRKTRGPFAQRFAARDWGWDDTDIVGDDDAVIRAALSGPIDELAEFDDNGDVTGGLIPVVEVFNEDREPQWEPFVDHIDGIRRQVLDRMTIATIQAFRQRAFKGLPETDEDGNPIDYEGMFAAAPGAIWDLPAGVDIWESGQVDMTGILAATRDDVKDLYAHSGTPGYLASPDAANASAEAASLQREMAVFITRRRRNILDPSLAQASALLFAYMGDKERSDVSQIEMIWAPIAMTSMTERSSAIAQTKGVIPRRQQLTEIWGMTPAQADRAMSELTDDAVLDQQFAIAQAAANANVRGANTGG